VRWAEETVRGRRGEASGLVGWSGRVRVRSVRPRVARKAGVADKRKGEGLLRSRPAGDSRGGRQGRFRISVRQRMRREPLPVAIEASTLAFPALHSASRVGSAPGPHAG
jgi:hypothetical protein